MVSIFIFANHDQVGLFFSAIKRNEKVSSVIPDGNTTTFLSNRKPIPGRTVLTGQRRQVAKASTERVVIR